MPRTRQTNSTSGARLGRAIDLRETNNPLCQRVNHLTLRMVIVDGLNAGRDVLAAQLALKQENQLRTMAPTQAGLLTPAQQAVYDRRELYAGEVMAELKRRLAEVEERIRLYASGGIPNFLRHQTPQRASYLNLRIFAAPSRSSRLGTKVGLTAGARPALPSRPTALLA